jgi:hypothetical protein
MEASMLVGASEGQGWRYEVIERSEGFLVRSRDLDTGAVDDNESQLFRTASVAFAFAAMSASFDRFAAACVAGEAVDDLWAQVTAKQSLYEDLRRRLSDDAMEARVLLAWEEAEETALRRRYH